MCRKKILIMNKQSIWIFLISLFLVSCNNEEPKYYRTQFYPVKQINNEWVKNEFFTNGTPITIGLRSRIDYDNPSWVGRFEPIDTVNASLLIGSDIYLGNDTIKKFTNLIKSGMARVEKGDTLGSEVCNYIIWINKNLKIDYTKNKGYFTIYFKTSTSVHNYSINDSTVVFIE